RDIVLLKPKHVERVRSPRSVRPGARIGSESGLAVGCRRHHAKATIEFPGPLKEDTDRLAARIPLWQERHSVRSVLFQEGDKAVQIKRFPSLQVTANQLFLCSTRRGCDRRSTIGKAFGERLARPLQGAVD